MGVDGCGREEGWGLEVVNDVEVVRGKEDMGFVRREGVGILGEWDGEERGEGAWWVLRGGVEGAKGEERRMAANEQ